MRKHFSLSVTLTLCMFLVTGPLLAMAPSSRNAKLPVSRIPDRGRSDSNIRKSAKPPAPIVRPVRQAPALDDGQTATLLPDGRWLVVGGAGPNGPRAEASIKDPRSGLVMPLASRLQYARKGHSATLLPDGTVLIFGGVGANGQLVVNAELLNPATQRFEPLPSIGLSPRSYHTATLLTDGRVLFAGGASVRGRLMGKVETWDTQTNAVVAFQAQLQTARQKQTATLLPSGDVLLWAGIDEHGMKLESGEIFDPETQSFSWVNSYVDQDEKDAPRLEASLPDNGTIGAPVETRIALRFSQPLRVGTVSSTTVMLAGPVGAVQAKVVPAEGGLLAFVTPLKPLESDTSYTLTLDGSVNRNNLAIPFTVVSFKTIDAHPEETPNRPSGGNQAAGNNGRIPEAQNPSSNPSNAATKSTPQAAANATALAGQVKTVSGQPLANVTLQVGDETALTDQSGRFLLTSLPSGTHGLTILGETASSPGKTYGTFDVKVDIAQGRTTVLPYTIWLPVLDTQYAVRLSVPTTRETVVTTPRIPGMEVRVPSSAVLRTPKGMHHLKGAMHMSPVIDSMAITPIPTDRTPFPLPPGITKALVFTLQLHGAKVEGPNGEKRPGMRIIFPNSLGLPSGSRVDFWNYESNGAGWYLYGQGTVTPDGRQVMPDPGVELQSMHCLSFMTPLAEGPGAAPAPGGCCKDGDPVDLGTGIFEYSKTDLVLSDVIPIGLARTYRQNDTRGRSFGIGMSHPYEMFIVGDSNTFGELILPDGGRIRYNHDTSRTDGVWGEHTATPTAFYKSTLTYNTTREPAGWDIKFQDGTIYKFDVIIGRFGFPGSAILSTIEDRNGNKLTITGSRITSPNGRWIEFTRNAMGYIIQAKDNTERVVTYTYDANNRLWKVTDPKLGVTEYTYDAAGRMQTIKDARGIVYLTNEYDASGRVFKQTQADQTIYQFAYTVDASNKITQTDVTDPGLNVRRVTFNASGYSLTDTRAVGKPEQQTHTYERQAGNNLILSVIDPLSRKTSYSYNSSGNVTGVTFLDGTSNAVTVTRTYEPRFNQIASVTDPLSHTTTYAYNGRGNLASITDALGHKTTFGYNPVAQLTYVSDALGNTAQFKYSAGILVEVIDPLGHSSRRATDGAGRVTQMTNPLGAVTSYQYDELNQPTHQTDPLQGVTAFSYDPNSNLLSVTDARQGETHYTYDSMDRIKTRQDPLLHQDVYDYEAGRLKQITDRKGQITSLSYDALNRIKQVTYADISTINYTYDAGNRVTQILDSASGTLTYTYDDLDHLTSETSAQGAVNYVTDAVGRRTSMSVAGQPTINYTYDNANRLTGITQGSSTITMGYDDADRRTSLTLPNGMVTEYGYDAGSQLTSLTYKRNGVVLGNLTYTYDLAGQRIGLGGSYARTLSPQTLTSATYNAANQQTAFGNQTLSYDLNGNLLNDGTNTYTWNARNQLIALTGPGASASFQYDATGRRISKTINGVTTNYLYDGVNVVQELSGTTPTANLLNGGLDQVFTRADSTGTWNPLTDSLGSTLALTDSSGTIQSSYTYDAFGKTATSGVSSSNSSQYTGRENDATGLYYNRNRYYSPALQRFISEDPIGMSGGINLYAYVNNNPTGYVDPFGLNPLQGAMTGARIGGAVGGVPGALIGAGLGIVVGYIIINLIDTSVPPMTGRHVDGPLAMSCTAGYRPPALPPFFFNKPDFLGQENGPAIPVPVPPAVPSDPPGPGWVWKGKNPTPGSPDGNWTNPGTGESLHPDLGHPAPIGPHWDWKDPNKNWWRRYPDGRLERKR